MAEQKRRPRTFRSALAAWPEAMAEVEQRPSVETLDSLCTLLDVMDGEIARQWKTEGHEARLTSLAECRAAARHAHALVSAAALASAKARGVAAAAAKKAKAEAA